MFLLLSGMINMRGLFTSLIRCFLACPVDELASVFLDGSQAQLAAVFAW